MPPAGVTDPVAGNNSATDTDALAPSADIRVVKTGTASVGYGGALAYSVIVSNLGPSAANGTSFSDAVPAAIAGVTASCGTPTGGAACGAVNVAGNSVTSVVTTLPAGSSVTFTVNGTAPASGASVTNSATATPPAGVADPVPGNNTGTATTTLLQPQLAVTKSATPNPVVAGGVVTFTIAVTNNGPSASTNFSVQDTPPTGLVYVDGSAGGTGWSSVMPTPR